MGDLLKNPHRRKILEALSQRKAASISEIAGTLGLSAPTVYYHLELLKGCVVKTARGEYAITEEGLRLYTESIRKEAGSKPIVGASLAYSLFSIAAARPSRFLPFAFAAGALEFLLCRALMFEPRLMSFSRSIQIEALPYAVPLNLLILFLLLEIMSYFVTRRSGGELALFSGLMISRIPLWAALADPLIGLGNFASILLLAASQLLSIYLLSVSVSLSKGIKQEISIIMCLVLLYLSFVVGSF